MKFTESLLPGASPFSAAGEVRKAATVPLDTAFFPAFEKTLPGKVVLALAATIFIALSAHVSVPLPFTPVPLTLSDLAVILVGLFLSPVTAFAALILYLGEGAMGLPVFNPGGAVGLAHLRGVTAGFLFAYPLASCAASAVVRALKGRISRFAAGAVAATSGLAIIMVLGVAWLGTLLHLSPEMAFNLGALPFLPGELIKIAIAAGIFSSFAAWSHAGKASNP